MTKVVTGLLLVVMIATLPGCSAKIDYAIGDKVYLGMGDEVWEIAEVTGVDGFSRPTYKIRRQVADKFIFINVKTRDIKPVEEKPAEEKPDVQTQFTSNIRAIGLSDGNVVINTDYVISAGMVAFLMFLLYFAFQFKTKLDVDTVEFSGGIIIMAALHLGLCAYDEKIQIFKQLMLLAVESGVFGLLCVFSDGMKEEK